MSNESPARPATAAGERYLPLLLLLLAASGCAALIYEVSWYQLLQLAIGSTAVSLGVLLATFMGGLCLGSILFPRLRLESRHPLRMFAVIEAGIGVCGVLVVFGIPLVDRLYIAAVGYGLPGMLLRSLVAAVCLLPPTVLMGASLPAVSRWIESTPRGASWWGFLYGANTAGAVFGCLLAGFYLLRVHNTVVATFVAAGLNLLVAAVSLLLSTRVTGRVDVAAEPQADTPASRGRWPVYVTIALSGAGALGAEVIWTRLTAMLLGSTVYVFSIILAVFLVGLALGTGAGSRLSRDISPRLALGWCQVLLCLGIAWTAFIIARSLPYWPVNPMLSTNPWTTFQLDMVRCLWAMLPPAVLWGASFPLALAAVAERGGDPGRLVGGVYGANTFGAILGALGVSLVAVPWAGTQRSQQILLALSAFSALFILAPDAWRRRSKLPALALWGSMAGVVFLVRAVPAIPGELIAYGRHMPTTAGTSRIIFSKEGRNSSVVITEWPDGTREIAVNGHVQATTTPFDMKLQRMVGHLAALLHPRPESVLGIGFGAGVSAGTFTRYPSIRRITICEIEPVIPPTSTRFFGPQNYFVMNDPRTRIVYDDARHFVLTTREKYDIVASDPLDVFAKGTAALYSVEYFEAVKRRLNPGGVFTLYVPLYESDARTVRSELATFFEAFPHGTVWANTIDGRGYDMVFMGQAEPMRIDLDELDRRFNHPDYAPVAESLRGIGVYSPVDLLATYAGQKSDLGPWVQGSDLNRDRDLRLQYLAGWGINSRLEDQIYREMVRFRQPPENLFTGSPARIGALHAAISAGGSY